MNNLRAPLSIFLAALVLLIISSRDTFASRRHNYPLRPPEEIEHALGVLRLHDLDSQRVSVTFWCADDAASRLENIKEAARARLDPGLTHVGVNLGDSPELVSAYLRRDSLGADSMQLHVLPDVAQSLLSTYGLRTLYR